MFWQEGFHELFKNTTVQVIGMFETIIAQYRYQRRPLPTFTEEEAETIAMVLVIIFVPLIILYLWLMYGFLFSAVFPNRQKRLPQKPTRIKCPKCKGIDVKSNWQGSYWHRCNFCKHEWEIFYASTKQK